MIKICKLHSQILPFAEEAEDMKILFYKSSYLDLFGSIFPTVDICSLIPDEEADVAILEEPEHLNWFRVPAKIKTNEQDNKDSTEEEKDKATTEAEKIAIEKAELGWAVKFKHVVGILHTNYSAYMRQYSMGTSFVAASALGALSSVVVRAYCHRVIRLSATLPELDEAKEITSNVHGVRTEFLEPPQPVTPGSGEKDDFVPNSIYFIGKLIWAKGFDKMLQVQEGYREQTGEYFPLDIYGNGNDEEAIKRAFFGRKGLVKGKQDEEEEKYTETREDKTAALVFNGTGSLRGLLEDGKDQNIEVVYDEMEGFDSNLVPVIKGKHAGKKDDRGPPNPMRILEELTEHTKGTGLKLTMAVGRLTDKLARLGQNIAFSKETKEDVASEESSSSSEEEGDEAEETSKDEVAKGGEKASAVVPRGASKKEEGGSKKHRRPKFRFDPPKSRFELRRHPIPAQFLGVKDHAVMRDIPQCKIFLNLSTTEVLCTTTAEALAMGKFAIIPNHRKSLFLFRPLRRRSVLTELFPMSFCVSASNEFFLQFPNCLAYSNKDECIYYVKYALENDPTPLTEEHVHAFSWEGATERLCSSSALTKAEVRKRRETGADEADLNAARFHVESGRKGQFIQKLIQGRK
jgi:hypothetical protein